MLCLDLCSGMKTATKAMADRGWRVVTVDIDPAFSPEFVADVREWSWTGPRPDLIWASPPCDEFSREAMPWSRTGKTPDLSIYQACLRIIRECCPRFWVIENTRGAQKYFGRYKAVRYPYYFWGHFPALGHVDISKRKPKEKWTSANKAGRATIPYEISLAFCLAVERAIEMELVYA